MKAKLLHSYVRSPESYVEMYDKITKEESEHKEEFVRKIGQNPPEERLKEFKDLLEKEHQKSFSDQEIRESFQSLFTFGSFAMAGAVKKYRDERREKRIKEWIKEAKAKDKRILSVTPFDNIKCSVCQKVMEYKWSDLHEKGAFKNPKSSVMFFYECLAKCQRKLIFEDGSPWISQDNKCPICNGERKVTVTKDNHKNIFYIYECVNCGSKQVET